MKWVGTEQREPAKSDWFLQPAPWLPLCIPSTESAASACRCRIPLRQRLPSRNPGKRKRSPLASCPRRQKNLPRKAGKLNPGCFSPLSLDCRHKTSSPIRVGQASTDCGKRAPLLLSFRAKRGISLSFHGVKSKRDSSLRSE